MKCERALEILTSVKNKIEVITSYEEVAELVELALVSEFKEIKSDDDLQQDLTNYKMQFNQLSHEVRNLSKELIILEGDYSDLNFLSQFVSHLSLGHGSKLRKQIRELKSQIKYKEVHISSLKNDILRLNDQINTVEQAIKVNGKRIYLTPFGETIIDEITVRKRYYSRDLQELIKVINNLNSEFMTLIYKVENIMRRSVFSPVWAVYLININKENLATAFNSITNSDYNYKNSEKRMMKLSLHLMKNPNFLLPRTNRQAKDIANQMKYAYREENLKDEIINTLNRYNVGDSRVYKVISLLGKIFSTWISENYSNKVDSEKYLENLENLFKNREIPQITNVINDENLFASMILAFSDNVNTFTDFYNRMKDIPEISKIFSSIATLFPWEPEETWMVLLRAESNILRAQSAKFIPELIEYALLLSMNPRILSIENELSQEELKKWQNLIIPAIHLFIYSYLEKDLEQYIKGRPLAYIISPRYYIYSSLHYHVIG